MSNPAPLHIDPLHIVLTIHHPLDRATGAPGVTLALAEAYAELGHEVDVIGFDGLRVRDDRLRRLVFPAYVAARLWVQHRRRPIDVIDSSTGDAAWWCRVRRGPRPALIVRSHGLEHPTYESQQQDARLGLDHLSVHYRLFQERIELPRVRRTLRAADAVTVFNHDDFEYATTRLGVDARRVHVVSQGVDDALVDAAAARKVDRAERTIVSIGSFIPRKGTAYVVPAVSEIMAADPSVRVRFLGTGVDADIVRAAFAPDLRARVEVVPRFERDELVGLVGAAPIGVLASVREGSPVALIEMMALGLAIVVAHTPGMAETVGDDETGVVVPPRDSDALRDGLRALLDDPERARRLGQAAQQQVQERRWSVQAERTVEIYRTAINGRSGRSGR